MNEFENFSGYSGAESAGHAPGGAEPEEMGGGARMTPHGETFGHAQFAHSAPFGEQSSVEGMIRPRISVTAPPRKNPHRKSAILVAVASVLNVAVLAGSIAAYWNTSLALERNRAVSSLSPRTEAAASLPPSVPGAAQTTLEGMIPLSVPDIALKAGPAVVGIISKSESVNFFQMEQVTQGSGSGIIISSDGYILTNNHVVSDASSLTVVLNTGSEFSAKIVGNDAKTDLAVIKIDPAGEVLTIAELGDSDKLQVGEPAIAIGNPMGQEFAGSVTVGVISAVNRNISDGSGPSLNLLQTDAAINQGNSGGALVNQYGQVIGINTIKIRMVGVEGMGFSIPISSAKPIISDLMEHGYVKGRPVIGISTRTISARTAQSQGWPAGIQIMQVVEGSGADIAGLERGDIITKCDGQTIKTLEELNKMKDTRKAGDTLSLEVYKYGSGQTATVNVKLQEERPQ